MTEIFATSRTLKPHKKNDIAYTYIKTKFYVKNINIK